MESELHALEQRVGALVALATELRSANIALRQQVVALQSDNRQLAERMATASSRVEVLLRKLPATAE